MVCCTSMSILVCNHLDGEERTGCFVWFVLLVSRDCCVTLSRGEMTLSAVCGCGIPDHTHFFPIITNSNEKYILLRIPTYNYKAVHFISTLAR